MKRLLLLSLVLFSIGPWLAGCRPAPGPVTVPAPIPTPAPSATPTLAATLSPTELFARMSRDWTVAFIDAGSRRVCVMCADGSQVSCLDYLDYDYPGGHRRKLGCWLADGSQFVYDRNDDTGIFLWEPGGILTAFRESGEGRVYRRPSCSTDGKYIAYQVAAVAGWDIPEDVPGTYVERLGQGTPLRISAGEVSVAWSPDGGSLLISGGDIHVAGPDGANPHQLTQDGAGYLDPAWSPDGQQIAFVRQEGSRNGLYVMNADGSGAREITSLDVANSYSPYNFTWLPSGEYILYDDMLIDVAAGTSAELSFPFDPSSAVWLTQSAGSGVIAPVAPQ